MEISYNLDEIDTVAVQVLAFATLLASRQEAKTILFNAPMGSGKTTLISAICRALGVKEAISSPTFSIVNEYEGKDTYVLHFDLYRLQKPAELQQLGFEDYLDRPNTYIFIEWPELAMPFLEEYHTVELKLKDAQTRILSLK